MEDEWLSDRSLDVNSGCAAAIHPAEPANATAKSEESQGCHARQIGRSAPANGIWSRDGINLE
jgi:hypothetical protein